MFGKRKQPETNGFDFDGGFDTGMDMDMDINIDMNDDTKQDSDNSFEFDDLLQNDGSTESTTRGPHNYGNGILKGLGIVAAVLCLILVGYLIISSVMGPTRWQCKGLLSDFESSCKTLDIRGMADCIDPVYGVPIKAAVGVVELLSDEDMNALLGKVFTTIGLADLVSTETGLQNVITTFEIKPERYGFPGRKRVVRCSVSIMGVSKKAWVTIKKRDGEPYIAKVEF